MFPQHELSRTQYKRGTDGDGDDGTVGN